MMVRRKNGHYKYRKKLVEAVLIELSVDLIFSDRVIDRLISDKLIQLLSIFVFDTVRDFLAKSYISPAVGLSVIWHFNEIFM